MAYRKGRRSYSGSRKREVHYEKRIKGLQRTLSDYRAELRATKRMLCRARIFRDWGVPGPRPTRSVRPGYRQRRY